MSEERARGEMPFLDHLEELRWRILWSLLALVLGTVVGFLLVQNVDILALLKRPIAPFLPEGRLFITRPTDAFMITLKLALVVGIVLAAPVVVWQIWAFLSPALYERERRFVVPAMLAGLVLFIGGVVLAYLWVLPAALRILFSFQRADLETIITADAYFTFAAQLMLAFGVMFELPLVVVLLAAFGIVNPQFFAKNRPFALVIAAIVAAFLTPPDVVSMTMLLVPLMLLYEGGIIVARIVWRSNRERTIGAAVLLVIALSGFLPGTAEAQRERRGPPDSARVAQKDSLARAGPPGAQALDTAAARRLGLPTAPSRSFPPPDSILTSLLQLEGYRIIRYAGDSVVLFADSQAVELVGHALVEQEGATLEADTVRLRQSECRLAASGDPALFEKGTVLTGDRMRYDTCERRGFVEGALTNFEQSGVDWFLRGGLSVDSASVRLFAGGNPELTSCDLPDAHYHFQSGSVKWVNNTILIARPATLYVRDVPVLWLPFIFQDMRPGRRSGFLVPRFGINDLIRPNAGYARHVTNVGYYFALSDYFDVQLSTDWYSGSSVSLNSQLRYRWLNQFMQGGIGLTRLWEDGADGAGGGRSLRLQWGHQQSFDLSTRLSASVDYVTSARVLERNAVDPYLATATLGSSVNFSKRFSWGTMVLGGNLRQDLTNNAVTQTLPSFSLTPVPLDVGPVTWTPSLTLRNDRAYNQFGYAIEGVPLPGDTVLPLDSVLVENRVTDLQLATPLNIGGWNWQNSLSIRDEVREQRSVERFPDPNNPSDTLTRYNALEFQTAVDWNTGFSLPTIFPGSWKLQPSVGIQNTTSGPFMVKNRRTNGQFVMQGKRLSFGASLSPSLFGFFPGFGPLARIRHKVSPTVRWSFAPGANVPEDYARATQGPGANLNLRSPVQNQVSVGLSQNFEGKLRPAAGDTTTDPRNARKIKLLSISTSDVVYDFEQAKEEGRTGWRTDAVANQVTSDLLPGFSLSMSHDLWIGQVGTDSARFSPFLNRVSARFTISERTITSIIGMLSGRGPTPTQDDETPQPLDTAVTGGLIPGPTGDRFQDYDRRPMRGGGRRPFSLSVTYDDQRVREEEATSPLAARGNRTVGLSIGFDPTRNWAVSWSTQYNLTTKEFGQHVIRLERDLHRWRATFQFLKSPNGNFAFNFFISLLDQPDIKFTYDQQTVER